jgi:hypothetical protein
MPISTNINSPDALYALMTTTDSTDLGQTYTQTANIDMTNYRPSPSGDILPSRSIAEGLSYVFSGLYNGNGFTITIANVVSTYTGLFDSITAPSTITNVNVIYNNLISQSSITVWGGLVGSATVSSISNCSVRINGGISVALTNDSYAGLICGFMGQESTLTNSTVTINNNSVVIIGANDSEIGLLCGLSEDSNISDCSIIGTSGTYDISLKANSNTDSDIGLICGYCGVNITTLTPQRLSNITVSLNNTGTIIIDSNSGGGNINKGAICGTVAGVLTDVTIIDNCTININNNQTLTGDFSDFFGQVTDITQITACQFNYATTTNNTSRPITISPTPTVAAVIYTNSLTNIYSLASGGNYYIPNDNGTIALGLSPITLEKNTTGISINNTLQNIGTTYSSSTPLYTYSITVKGVGSMYFGFNYSGIPGNIIDTPEECICQVNSCSTNPQTGVTADSRITNTREDKTIRINVDREFARNAVIYPKFKSYSDYMKYLQGALKY